MLKLVKICLINRRTTGQGNDGNKGIKRNGLSAEQWAGCIGIAGIGGETNLTRLRQTKHWTQGGKKGKHGESGIKESWERYQERVVKGAETGVNGGEIIKIG